MSRSTRAMTITAQLSSSPAAAAAHTGSAGVGNLDPGQHPALHPTRAVGVSGKRVRIAMAFVAQPKTHRRRRADHGVDVTVQAQTCGC